ncbi:MAG TPA: R3H domain-containing nucleic acid-binding protein [Miltoncostaeaceae bacterium]|nr:R3H domain-containing nucleic acid-binding protein [Miltoncostaeaceae bacterium]
MGDPNATEVIEAVRAALDAVVAGVGVTATVVVGAGDENADVVAALEGDGLDVLIGRQGETIDGLQYLLTQIASRAGGGRLRVALDVGGYRERRATALRELAVRAAEEALAHGEEIELDPMTPHDRRIVHMALKDNSAIVTRSEGEEPRRRIIVEPAD